MSKVDALKEEEYLLESVELNKKGVSPIPILAAEETPEKPDEQIYRSNGF